MISTRRFFAVVTFLSVGSFGCVTVPVLTQQGTEVRLLVKAEPDGQCNELGDVSTGNDWLRDEGAVKIMLRNKAAELGANVGTLDVLKTSGNLFGGSGRAFKCP
jgi:hypothetical protein